ncbi:site-specific integrase [Rhizobium sp.]
MDDVPKIPYYMPGKKPKFKRAVPADLVQIVGKQNWVRGAANLSPAKLKEMGLVFALWTETEINRLRAGAPLEAAAQPIIKLELTDRIVDQILARYRTERENSRIADRSYFDAGDRPRNELLAEAQNDLSYAVEQAEGHRVETDRHAIRLLQRFGLGNSIPSVSESMPAVVQALQTHELFQRLCRLLEIEDIRLAKARLDALSLNIPPASAVQASVASPSLHKTLDVGMTLGDVTTEWLKTKSDRLSNSRKSQLSMPIRILHEMLGKETPVASITRSQCRELAAFLPKVPRHHAQHYKGMTPKAAAEAHRKKHGEYADRRDEAQKYVEIIRSIFKFAREEEWLEKNPWDGIAISRKPIKKFEEAERTYQPFPMSSLTKLFSHRIFGDRYGSPDPKTFLTHAYWAPLISLLSGMRMNEILQLEKADIQMPESGVAVFSVTDEEIGTYDPSEFEKRLKTAQSLRRIPVHPLLIEFGFLKWVAKQKAGRLFPEATRGSGEKPSDQYSKRFATVLKGLKIWGPRRNVFHSLRNNFNDALRAGGAEKELREAINGWKNQRSMDNVYGSGHTDQVLYEAIKKAKYPELDFSHIIANSKLIN